MYPVAVYFQSLLQSLLWAFTIWHQSSPSDQVRNFPTGLWILDRGVQKVSVVCGFGPESDHQLDSFMSPMQQ